MPSTPDILKRLRITVAQSSNFEGPKFNLLNRNSQVFRRGRLVTDRLLVCKRFFFGADMITRIITSQKRNVAVLLLLPPRKF